MLHLGSDAVLMGSGLSNWQSEDVRGSWNWVIEEEHDSCSRILGRKTQKGLYSPGTGEA